MSDRCSFERLVKLLDGELDLDSRLSVYDHIDRCSICREAVFLISRDRDCNRRLLLSRPYRIKEESAA